MTVATESFPDETTGQPRQALIDRVAENAGDDWKDRAWSWLEQYLRSHEFLRPDDAKNGGCPAPHDWRAAGSLVQQAKKRGWIVRCGTAVRENGTEGPLYRSTLWRAA